MSSKLFFKKGKKKVICFDLEGPLSPTDFAFELMKLIPRGDKIFPVVSRYDDLLTLEGKKYYQPGDTLGLITPFLIYWGITEKKIKEVSSRATLTDGSQELIKTLKKEGWIIYIVSTAYKQHAISIAKHLGIKEKNVFSTDFSLDKFQKEVRKKASKGELILIDIAVIYIPNFLYSENLDSGEKDEEIRDYLDRFFWSSSGKLGEIFERVKPIGGERKTEVLKKEICRREKCRLKDVVVIGDSITDSDMLKAVKEAGGLAIAFNANQYALPYALVGVASPNLREIKPVLDAWQKGRRMVWNLTEKSPEKYQWIGKKDIAKLRKAGVLKAHEESRRLARGKATARLG